MNCLMTIPVDGTNEAGWQKWQCARCGKQTGFTPHGPERIKFHGCTGLPLPYEYRHWLALFSEAFGLTRAAAIVRYIRWRAKGSPLDELPPGVPSPPIARPILTDAEVAELFPNEDPTLLGNRIKALTEAVGIPACGGCEARRKFINSCHAWLRTNLS